MKIAYCSDLHLESGELDCDLPAADVLVLAGDICNISDLRESFCGTLTGMRYREFFQRVSREYPRIIYVPGNHDYWGSSWRTQIHDTFNEFKKEMGLDNVTMSEAGSTKIGNVTIIWATLWTDFKGGDPIVMHNAQQVMNDYSWIEGIRPENILNEHLIHKELIAHNLEISTGDVVVVSHHSPIRLCGRFDNRTEHFYHCTDMTDLILDNPQITHWIHGHTHENHKSKIGTTTVVANCRGYDSEHISNKFAIEVIEV